MKIKFTFFVLVTVLVLGLVGCSQFGELNTKTSSLDITSIISTIGAVEGKEDNHDVQRYSYKMTLENIDNEEVNVKEIQLVLPSEFEERLLGKLQPVPVNQVISPKGYIEISGTLDFNASSLSKDEIIKINPRIEAVKVINEKTIKLDK